MTEQQDSGAPDPEVVREEAERLVAAGLAAVSMVADRIGAPARQRGGAAAAGYDALGDVLVGPADRRHSVANGSEECCRCPVCRVISAAREPDPDVAEKLATGVGTLAGGAARIARGVAGAVGSVWPARPEPAGSPADRPAGDQTPGVGDLTPGVGERRSGVEDDPWAAATAAASTEPASRPAEAAPATQVPAKQAVAPPTQPGKVVAKKVVAKKVAAKKVAAKETGVEKSAVEKTGVERTAAKPPEGEPPAEPGTRTPPDAAPGDAQ